MKTESDIIEEASFQKPPESQKVSALYKWYRRIRRFLASRTNAIHMDGQDLMKKNGWSSESRSNLGNK